MTTADMSLVAKESILVEKLKKKHAGSIFLSNTVHTCVVIYLLLASCLVSHRGLTSCLPIPDACVPIVARISKYWH